MADRVTLTELISRVVREDRKSLGTSIPGRIVTFDPSTQLATLQISIARTDVDGTSYTPPPLIECPVCFPGGAAFVLEFQIDTGDDGLIVFSQRCIDQWVTTGDVSPPPVLRFHDFADAMFIPGIRPAPRAISSHANNGVRMRDSSGANYVWLKNDGTAEITVDKLTVNGDMVHNGDMTRNGSTAWNGTSEANGDMVFTGGDVIADGISLKTHVHGGVQTGGADTEGPK